jgi:hypothetical protein
MYDMYPWNRGKVTRTEDQPQAMAPATAAIQVALDRRDGGGGAAAEPTAGPTRQ